ncbi:pentatricopeptide repeat-containing protein At3g25210, mitochondrial [Fagus crenata]
MPPFVHRRLLISNLLSTLLQRPLSSLHLNRKLTLLSLYHYRSLSTSPTLTPTPPPPNPKTKTPLETQFETWVHKLKPGFNPSDVEYALWSQSDPDLALDLFRWTALQRGYKHNHITYLTIIKILIFGKRYAQAETLVEEVLAGACDFSVPLYNSIIKFCCSRKSLFNRSFDVYKKMFNSNDCKPTLETYSMLLNVLLRRFNKLNVCYMYLPSVRSLSKQMKASGVIPDTFVLNMIIKAYAKCLEVDEAIRVFREMGLYGCEPNAYTYGYITQGLCEKGRVGQGFGFYNEMKGKGLIPSSSSYMVLICSLVLERRFEDAIKVLFDMLGNSMGPDLLTYKTLLEGLCREGRGNDAFELVDELRKRDRSMSEKMYSSLMNELHFLSRE